MKKLKLKKNIVIPAGTVFENIDGEKREYISDNYATLISLHNNMTAEFTVGYEKAYREGLFEEIEE